MQGGLFMLKPFKELVAMSKEKLDEAMAPIRARVGGGEIGVGSFFRGGNWCPFFRGENRTALKIRTEPNVIACVQSISSVRLPPEGRRDG
jgi:hypothetical protein